MQVVICYAQDLTTSLDVYKGKQIELLSSRRYLTTVVSAEDLMGLDQRLHLLDHLAAELREQILLRRAHIQRRLQRWCDFDERCRQLVDAIAKCESVVEGNNDVPIEKLIVLLQTVSWLCNSDYRWHHHCMQCISVFQLNISCMS